MAIITGTTGDDNGEKSLHGTSLADEIYGRAGNDALVGFDGDDVLEGGAGADDVFGSAGFDYASYRGSDQAVSISLGSLVFTGGHAQGDELFGIEGVIGSEFADLLLGDDQRNVFRGGGGADQFLGQSGNDTLYGEGGNDVLDGDNDNDLLYGGDGNDLLAGSGGDDVLNGGAGSDTAYFSGAVVVVNLNDGTATAAFGKDRLFGIENVTGTSFGDTLVGNGGANALDGRIGADVLTGGSGADRFVCAQAYDSMPAAPDVIRDFSRSQGDRIDVRGVDANEQVDGNQAFQFIGKNAFTGAGQLRWFQQNGDTVVEANTTDATAGADMVIVLDPLFSPQASDFVL